MKADKEHLASRVEGCLLAGACGDALGAPVEFMSLSMIRDKFGPLGIQDVSGLSPYGVEAGITDDTQMTLFTAEGLLRAYSRQKDRGICSIASVVHKAYLRWLVTQGGSAPAIENKELDGWLIDVPELHSRRAPGNTCLSALRSTACFGDEAQNDSKGCGAVMRVAPVGILAVTAGMGPDWAFETAGDISRLTHGHPSGYWSGAALAFLVARILGGVSLKNAAEETVAKLGDDATMEETRTIMARAIDLAESPGPIDDDIRSLGEGWVGEEALAIAVYCSLRGDSLKNSVIMAANHDGDSDSTASIAGNICGAMLGRSAIPDEWLAVLELKQVIDAMAQDLFDPDMAIKSRDRYPPS